MSDFRKHLEETMQDTEFASEWEALEPQYQLARQVISARLQKGLTQKQLADLVGTSQANISKIEHAEMNPSIEMTQRIASGLGKKLKISLL